MATLLSTTVNGTINSTGNTTAAGFTGNANVAGTGAATYHPSGIYSTGTNWLYGTMYLNGNDVYDINGIRAFYFYDRADTSYYVRPHSTSRVYHIHADHLSIGQGINTSYRVITNGDYYANGGGNFWAEGRFKQYRGSGTWHDVIDSGNIGSQSVNYAASAGAVAASGITGQTGMWTSSARPGPYRLYRNEDNSAYNVQTTWSADVSGYWSLRGYLNDSYHAPCYVGYAGYAPSAGNADTVDGYHESAFWRNDQNRVIGVLRFTGEGGDSGNGSIATSYGIYQQGGAWTHPYPDLCIGFHTGIKIGANSGYNGTRFYNDSNWATQIMSVGDGDNHVRVAENLYAAALHDSGSRVAISRGEGRNYVDYSRYVYNNGAYSGSGWIEPSDLGVRYAYYGRLAYNNGAYSGSGWVEPSDLGVRYANSAGSTTFLNNVSNYSWSSSTLPTSYPQGLQLSFVGPNSGEGSWQNYGTVLTARTYSGGGGSLQMYVPYGPSNGGDSLQVRFGNYNVSSGNSWTGWKTLIDSGTIGSQSVNYANSAGSVAWGNVTSKPGIYLHNTWHGNTYLGTGGDIYCTILYDSNNSGYYLDPNGTSRLNRTNYDYVYSYDWVYAQGDIIAYYSDERLKTKVGNIENALDKIKQLNGFYYVNNDLAKSFGYKSDKIQVGLSAQDVQRVLPEVVSVAPFDTEFDENNQAIGSKSGESYLTVNYDKLVPLLIESIKEQQDQIEELKEEIKKLKGE